VDISREMMRLTLGIVGKTLFDADVLGEADDVGRALTTVMRFFIGVINSPIRPPFAWIPPWQPRRQTLPSPASTTRSTA
jgi:hypothetical protein